MDKTLNIGVFFGSRSPEHDISIITAQLIISGLKGLGYQVTPVYLSKRGDWFLGEELGDLKIFTDPKQKVVPAKFKKYYLDLEHSMSRMVFKRKGLLGRKITIELAFPAFHGSFGEDGTIQGLFEIFNIPYVGCDVASSALAMDKILTKQLLREQNIPTTEYIFFDSEEWLNSKNRVLQAIREKFGFPVFIKPAKLGSSIGIAKVKTDRELELAVEVATHYSERFLAEESVENLMDITCAVLGNKEPIASLLQESLFADDFFTYEEKYLKGGGAQTGKARENIVIPARLPEKATAELRKLAIRIFKLFGCSGIARIDFLYDKAKGKYYANEINTLPGTLYHHLWQKSGFSLDQLLGRLISLAKEKHEAKNKTIYVFDSDLLRQTGTLKL